jgi:hypothetical protein
MRMALALSALLLPAIAAGQPALSLRLAYAPAFGSAADRIPMGDALGAQLPIQLDALWRFGSLAAGPYASWGLGVVSGCDDGASCRGVALRTGIEALLGLPDLRRGGLVPWAGVGVGWEWASRRRERLGNTLTWTWSGPEAHLQLGGEWKVASRLAVGPYLLVAGGRFERVALYTPVGSGTTRLRERAIHAWVHLGVRGAVDL